jgi:Spy/CpxP family protein refolding chaperone
MNKLKLLALLCLVMALTAAGCGRHYGRGDVDTMGERVTHEMNELIEKTVQDPEKAKKVEAVVADIVQEIKESYKQNRQFHRKLYELNANYRAVPEDFTKILDEMNNSRMRSATRILGLRFKMKEMLTAEEWKSLSDGMNKYRARYWHDKDGTDAGKSGG